MVRDENYHAEFSPSGADTWMVCAPAIAMQRDEPNESSQYADEGTDAHSLFADCLNLGVDAKEFIDDVLAKGTVVTDDFAAAVQISVNVVRERIAMWEKLGYTVRLEVEQRVPIGHLTEEEDAEGTSDVVLIATLDDDVQIEVLDLKFGKGIVVSAFENRQMRLYGLGAIKKFNLQPSNIGLLITQPRIDEQPSEWQTSPADLDEFAFEVEVAASKAREYFDIPIAQIKPEEFNPGEKQCRFCRAKAKCHGLATFTEKAIGSKFDLLGQEDVSTYVSPLTYDDLGDLFPKLDTIELWVKSVRVAVEGLLQAGEKVPNVKLVKSRKGHRKYTDDLQVEALLKKLRLKVHEMYDFKLVSPTQLEKTLKNSPRKWKKITEMIIQPPANDIVVLESDPRPAVFKPKIATLFQKIDDENEDLI